MNQQHYDWIKNVTTRSRELLLPLIGEGGDVCVAAIQGSSACMELWEKEFPVGQGVGTTIRLDLRGADLSEAVFARLFDTEEVLTGADFSDANLNNTIWSFIPVKKANFARATMRDSAVFLADFSGSSFQEADLSGTDFNMGSSESVDFSGANLTGAKIHVSQETTRFVFTGATMSGCCVAPATPRDAADSPVMAEHWQAHKRFLAGLSEEQRAEVVAEGPETDLEATGPDSAGQPGQSTEGCFIATACYGSPDCAEISILRQFRDGVMIHSIPGRALVALYYRVSPSIARLLHRYARLRILVRECIVSPIVKWIEKS